MSSQSRGQGEFSCLLRTESLSCPKQRFCGSLPRRNRSIRGSRDCHPHPRDPPGPLITWRISTFLFSSKGYKSHILFPCDDSIGWSKYGDEVEFMEYPIVKGMIIFPQHPEAWYAMEVSFETAWTRYGHAQNFSLEMLPMDALSEQRVNSKGSLTLRR